MHRNMHISILPFQTGELVGASVGLNVGESVGLIVGDPLVSGPMTGFSVG